MQESPNPKTLIEKSRSLFQPNTTLILLALVSTKNRLKKPITNNQQPRTTTHYPKIRRWLNLSFSGVKEAIGKAYLILIYHSHRKLMSQTRSERQGREKNKKQWEGAAAFYMIKKLIRMVFCQGSPLSGDCLSKGFDFLRDSGIIWELNQFVVFCMPLLHKL